jgi:hypothetical protein
LILQGVYTERSHRIFPRHFPSGNACACTRYRRARAPARRACGPARAAKHRIPAHDLAIQPILVGARVERISSAGAPEMCPFSKTIREYQTVRETFQGFASPTGQRPGAQVPVPPQLPCVRCWRWPRRCWRARSPIAAASTTRPSTVFRVGPPCSGQQRTGTPALGKPRKRHPSDGGPRVRIHFPPAQSQSLARIHFRRSRTLEGDTPERARRLSGRGTAGADSWDLERAGVKIGRS